MITSGMLQPMRDVGLDCSPASFATNACESLNAMLKRKVNYKKNKLPAFVDHLKSLIDEQESWKGLLLEEGNIASEENFQHLQVEVWFRMSRDQHLKKVAHSQINCSEDQSTESHQSKELSIPRNSNIPLLSVQAIWNNAAELVSQPTTVAAPGHGTE